MPVQDGLTLELRKRMVEAQIRSKRCALIDAIKSQRQEDIREHVRQLQNIERPVHAKCEILDAAGFIQSGCQVGKIIMYIQ